MKKIIIQEAIRAMAIGSIALMVLANLYSMGLIQSPKLVMYLVAVTALLSFIGFTFFRSKSGKEMMVRTKRGWIIVGMIFGIALLAYFFISYNKNSSLLNNVLPTLLGLIVLATAVWWGVRRAKGNG